MEPLYSHPLLNQTYPKSQMPLGPKTLQGLERHETF
jgi:hypothetical protein